MWVIVVVAAVAVVIGIDMRRNFQSYRNFGQWVSDMYWSIGFAVQNWPAALLKAHMYSPRHSRHKTRPWFRFSLASVWRPL